jgi:hypothetical protein
VHTVDALATVQVAPETEQVPLTFCAGQLALEVHAAPVIVQVLPCAGHVVEALAAVHAALVMLHFMFCVRHLVAAFTGVHAVPVCMLQWPLIGGHLLEALAVVQ